MATAGEQVAAMVELTAAETAFLQALMWTLVEPEEDGKCALWKSPGGVNTLHLHAEALRLAKSEWVQLYER